MLILWIGSGFKDYSFESLSGPMNRIVKSSILSLEDDFPGSLK